MIESNFKPGDLVYKLVHVELRDSKRTVIDYYYVGIVTAVHKREWDKYSYEYQLNIRWRGNNLHSYRTSENGYLTHKAFEKIKYHPYILGAEYNSHFLISEEVDDERRERNHICYNRKRIFEYLKTMESKGLITLHNFHNFL